MSSDQSLTAEQVGKFFRQGFLVIETPQIVGQELERCHHILMHLIERGVGREEGRNFDLAARSGGEDLPSPQMVRPSLYAAELARLSCRSTALAFAKQLLGPDASFAMDNSILKPRRNGGPTPWHQDEAYNDPRHYQEQVSFWIAITNSTIENGAMAYIPGSHLLGILPHRLHGGSAEANSIECCEGFDPTAAETCPIPAGAMIIHHGRTLHGASPNKSDRPRLAYILTYKTPPRRRVELGEFPWNERVGKSSRMQRGRWLLRGGIFPELWRFLRSDRDAHRHFFDQVRRRLFRS
ncbi:MAG TPA: phytanoyl-CoA dioxygenase family protein [Steroidobacteraceae bacterium]